MANWGLLSVAPGGLCMWQQGLGSTTLLDPWLNWSAKLESPMLKLIEQKLEYVLSPNRTLFQFPALRVVMRITASISRGVSCTRVVLVTWILQDQGILYHYIILRPLCWANWQSLSTGVDSPELLSTTWEHKPPLPKRTI